jgi:hypothetical protein
MFHRVEVAPSSAKSAPILGRSPYQCPASRSTAHAHESYGNELGRAMADPREAGAHWLAAALIYQMFGDHAGCDRIIGRFRVAIGVVPPDTLQAVIDLVERTPRVSLGTVFAQTNKDIPSLFRVTRDSLRTR